MRLLHALFTERSSRNGTIGIRSRRDTIPTREDERKDFEMLWFGAAALALLAMSTTWGPAGTAAILVLGASWLVFAFQPGEVGALMASIARRRVK
jgi:hypothetical protein